MGKGEPMIVPSEELLSELLGSKVRNVSPETNKECEIRNGISFENNVDGISYTYVYGNQETRFMPLDEVMSKCKEWSLTAHDKGFSTITENFAADTEFKAAFEACEWVYLKTKR